MDYSELKVLVEDFCAGLIAKESTDDMCFAVCVPLVGFLDMIGVDAQLMCGEFTAASGDTVEHYWIETSDGVVIDPTADQLSRLYGLPALPANYVGEKPDWYVSSKSGW